MRLEATSVKNLLRTRYSGGAEFRESEHFAYGRVLVECIKMWEFRMAIVARNALTKRGKLRKKWAPVCAFELGQEPPLMGVRAMLRGLDAQREENS